MKPNEFFEELEEIVGLYSRYLNNPGSATNADMDAALDDLSELLAETLDF